jgi:hypothetical protein
MTKTQSLLAGRLSQQSIFCSNKKLSFKYSKIHILTTILPTVSVITNCFAFADFPDDAVLLDGGGGTAGTLGTFDSTIFPGIADDDELKKFLCAEFTLAAVLVDGQVTSENGFSCSFISGDRYKVGGEGDRDSDASDCCGEQDIEGDLDDNKGVGEDKAGGVGVRGTSTDVSLYGDSELDDDDEDDDVN